MHIEDQPKDIVGKPLSITELVSVLEKHYGVEEGKFDLAMEFQIGTGPVGPNKDEQIPGVIFGIKSVALRPKSADSGEGVPPSLPDEKAVSPDVAPKKSARGKKA